MAYQTNVHIRKIFATSTDFNEIFDAFEAAVYQGFADVDLYRLLFWNPSLTEDEVRLFGEKVAAEFPGISFDIFLWLARMFEALHASKDNYELAFHYFEKAAVARPSALDPYLEAADCYEPDLNIPPLDRLIDFLKEGATHVEQPALLYEQIAHCYELAGMSDDAEAWRRKARELPGSETASE